MEMTGRSGSIKKRPVAVKERWLLTRKTWRYMADAGRCLLPDGVQNRHEDVPKIEAHFQDVCRNEPKYMLWRRKSSFPESVSEARYRKKRNAKNRSLVSTDEEEEGQSEEDENVQKDKSTMRMLEKCLGEEKSNWGGSFRVSIENLSKKLYHHNVSGPSYVSPSVAGIDRETLLENLRAFSMRSRIIPAAEIITYETLKDRKFLKKIYKELKQHELARIFRKRHHHSCSNVSLSQSMTNIFQPSKYDRNSSQRFKDSFRKHPLPLTPHIEASSSLELQQSTNGTQTDAITIEALNNFHKEYKQRFFPDDDTDGSKSGPDFNRRRSSVDNEDVSESVSTTIKRYLRMARKKSGNEKDPNRFRSINYDRTLRNIKPKCLNISILAIDSDIDKGTQTEDDWTEAVLKSPSDLALIGKIISESDTTENPKSHSAPPTPTCSTASAQSGSGIIQTGTNFISNLLGRGGMGQKTGSACHSNDDINALNNFEASTAMQKSKSSSNVGSLVSKKMWKSRSKSQTRVSTSSLSNASSDKPQWTPQGNCIWTTLHGGRKICLTDTGLQSLSTIEREVLRRVALEKLQQLNIGVNSVPPAENKADNTSTQANQPKPKRRALLLKRKALTTGFFDTGGKNDDKNPPGRPTAGQIFGISLEQCLSNENRLTKVNGGRSQTRSSFSSLLDINRDSNDKGSCESLPAIRTHSNTRQNNGDSINDGSSQPNSSIISSFSHSDIRRCSNDGSDLRSISQDPMVPTMPTTLNVPTIVTACIRNLETHGLQTVGLFRVSTSKKRVRQLREDFDCGSGSISFEEDVCPHDVATLLKEFFRDLPEPLLCRDLYPAFVETQKIRNRRIQLEALSCLIQLLPIAHRDTLFVLLRFLAKVARFSVDSTSQTGEVVLVGNKMDSNNLATVFAPNILHCTKPGKQTTEQEVDERIDVINIVRMMIDHYDELYKVSSHVIDEVYTNMMETHPQELDYLCHQRDTSDRDVYCEKLQLHLPLNSSSSLPLSNFQMPIESQVRSASSSDGEMSGSKKMYSRENVLHQNTGKGLGSKEIPERIRKHGERISRMKYQDDVSSTPRRRHRDSGSIVDNSRIISGDASNLHQTDDTHSRYTEATRITPDYNQHHEMTRRMSSPHLVKASDVLTATLQIPVQVHKSAGSQDDYVNQEKLKLTLRDEFNDIPYIEENADTVLTPSLQEEYRNEYMVSMTKNDGQIDNTNTILKSNSMFTIPHRQPTRKLSGSASTSAMKIFSIPSDEASYQMEPKITPSISNIGNTVMKSKTAEFEKKSGGGSSSSSQSSRRPGQIYKRQELISSVQRSKK